MGGPRKSILPADAVFDQRLGNAALRVFAALGVYADKKGTCYPKLRTLGDSFGISKQTVHKHIEELVNLGYVEKSQRKREDGSNSSCEYHIKSRQPEVNTRQPEANTPSASEVNTPSASEVNAYNDPLNDPLNGNDVFEKFWQKYPSRKPHSNPKKPALKKFTAAVKNGTEPEAIILGAENYAKYVQQENIEPKYVKQATTFLNQNCWEEFQTSASKADLPGAENYKGIN
tara:strand:+ start:237 stop:926 length:690 start_codon:yes stop_codon:yes gene_type:complete